TRTFTATDACGNSATTSRTITWTQDIIAPPITVVQTPLPAGCNPSAAAISAALGSATATDNCGPVTPTSTDGSVSNTGCIYSQTRTFTATDACGNSATTSRTITWTQDIIAPPITVVQTPLPAGCNPSAAAISAALGSATATDNCGPVTPTSTDGSVSNTGCIYSQTRTFTATDACGNSASTSRTITWTQDIIAPPITVVQTPLPAGCNPSAAAISAALGSATATDNCGPVTPTSTDGSVSNTGCIYSQTRTFTATDACGNSASTSRTITWTQDIIAPPITVVQTPLPAGCNPSAAAISAALGSATATDNCGPVTPTSTDGSVSNTGCIYSQTRTFTATDACGNSASTSRTITWTQDIIAPPITVVQTPLPAGCNPSAAAISAALGSATATDNCGPVTPTSTDGSVSNTGCIYSQTRTFTATDACGNSASTSRTITWTQDIIAPTITVTQTPLPAGCNPSAAAISAALGSATATDNCGPVTPTSTDGSVSNTGCIYSQTRTFTATDACGNSATTSRTLTRTHDMIAPPITVTQTPLPAGCNPSAAEISAALGSATATDSCGPVTPTSTDGTVSNTGCIYSQTRTFTATDACGNSATTSRTITWTQDIIAPTITVTQTPLPAGC